MVAKYSTTKNRGIQTHTGNGSLLKLNSVNAVKLEKQINKISEIISQNVCSMMLVIVNMVTNV